MKKIIAFALAVVFTAAFASSGFALKKDVEFDGKGGGAVTFSHEQHTETVKNKCNDCHTALFQRKAGGTEGITMAAMGEGNNCGACHNGDKAFDVKSDDSCAKCHK
jgi:c(7)-type cytochrome triheme protein